MNEVRLTIPLKEEDVLGLSLGDLVYLDGTVFTARSLFHMRAVKEGILPPLDFKALNVMAHMGPVMKKTGNDWLPVSCEPTTSMRFEKYAAEVIPRLGLRALFGKDGMGPKTMEAMKQHGCVHLAKIGVYGSVLASRVTRVIGVHGFEELGPIECTWVMEVKDFGPLFVDIDAEGKSFFEEVKRETEKKLTSVYQKFMIPDGFRYSDGSG